MLTMQEINSLGQALDTTWGTSSTMGSPTMSLKGKVAGEELTLVYSTYATFASNVAMSQQLPRLLDEGQKAVNQYLKHVKSEFKKLEGRALKTKVIDADHNLEVVSLQPHVSPKRTVLFRFVARHEIA